MNNRTRSALTDRYSGSFWNDAPAALVTVVAFAAQNPGLDFRDYGNVTAYRSDSRRITKSWHDVNKAANSCRIHGVTDDDVRKAAEVEFSGRLSFNGDRLEYCTGQYWPTEYRAAAAAVLEYAAHLAYRRNCGMVTA